MNAADLAEVARTLVAHEKGILAADESTPTIAKRFQAHQIPCNEDSRRAYREMLFTTPGLGDFISGAILYDETIRQKDSKGIPFPELLRWQNIIPGIKVDRGAKPLAAFPGEKVTEGLDGLRERFAEYRDLGARFSKWRAVISISPATPTQAAIRANAHALGRFAALSQEAGLVPVVEPEVLMDGDHTIEQCECASELTLKILFDELFRNRVLLSGMLLKASMVLPGKGAPRAAVDEVARQTLATLRRTVPPAVPGVVFLSGGQDDVQATEHLNAMNQIEEAPWELSFSYGRALQAPALKAWGGKNDNVHAAQEALHHRARCNSFARSGLYLSEMEEEFAFFKG